VQERHRKLPEQAASEVSIGIVAYFPLVLSRHCTEIYSNAHRVIPCTPTPKRPRRSEKDSADGRGSIRAAAMEVLAVLQAFGAYEESVSLTGLARHTELPKSTTHRMVGKFRCRPIQYRK
jgi:hypothetical protein